MRKININGKNIGDDYPCYTIAEAGANHEGEVEKAFQLIDAAKESGVDAIKFQNYTASKLTTKTAPKYWDDGIENESQFDVFNKLDKLHDDEWRQIFGYANKKNITCFSTPFDEESVNLLYDLEIPAYKIASADITHIPLIKSIAAKKLPIFISTGMSSDNEIKYAIDTIENEGNHDIVIMHCITSYPTEPQDANLSMIKTLKEKFPNYVIGYSDHTIGTSIGVYSTFYGSTCIEKHFTFDSSLTESPDHRLSLDTVGFRKLVDELRVVEISKGESKRIKFDSETEAVKFARRSIVSTRKINVDEKIIKEMLDVKRPGTGISPKFYDDIIGKTVKNEIKEDEPIQWDNLNE